MPAVSRMTATRWDVRVDGDVQGENARAVNITMSSSVDGNIQVDQGEARHAITTDGRRTTE